jgi:hypothetical protein
METIIRSLETRYPHLTFKEGTVFTWSPQDNVIFYRTAIVNETKAVWSLLHEASHALLKHKFYELDFELVKLEAEAWQFAHKIAPEYGHAIDYDHIQDCLDTYRDWLHKRSTCPECHIHCLQQNATTYCCYNCSSTWHVTSSRLCRPYRKLTLTA